MVYLFVVNENKEEKVSFLVLFLTHNSTLQLAYSPEDPVAKALPVICSLLVCRCCVRVLYWLV